MTILTALLITFGVKASGHKGEEAENTNTEAAVEQAEGTGVNGDNAGVFGEMSAKDSEEDETNGSSKENAGNSAGDGTGESEDDANSQPEEIIKPLTAADMIAFDPEKSFEYCSQPVCTYDKTDKMLHFEVTFTDKVPKSDDDNIYLFEVATYEDESSFEEKKPAATADKAFKVDFSLNYRDRYLFAKFVPALLYEGSYVPLSLGQYVTNPEALALNTSSYKEPNSKKGLLLDGNTIGSDRLFALNVERLVYNIPLSIIMGETDDPEWPTIEYKYNGRTYLFNGYKIMVYDSLFSYLTENGFHCTAIVLNDWNKTYPEIIHPKSRQRTGKSMYYAFNTEDEDGVRVMEAAAMFLGERYSGGEHGMVYDWVIANEINQQFIWNYMATTDLDYYTDSFEKSFRTFYNAIKSNYSEARVYYSLDHDWNDNYGNNDRFFNGRDILYAFNDTASKHGNYDWGLSIHPYPYPLTKTRFWKGDYDKTEMASILTPMNFSTVTDIMTKDDFLDTKGNVRQIGVTELGFSSRAGEKIQAAAFAYCYYIIENNEYINSFLMNRQTDDSQALKSGLALGIYNNDYSPKYIAEVFAYIDGYKKMDYLKEMLDVIGASSLEEALSWAQ